MPPTSLPREARGVARLTVHIPSAFRKDAVDEKSSPPRWSTLEFRLYFLVAAVVIPLMAWIPVSLSQRE